MTNTTSTPVRSSANAGPLTPSDSTIYSPPLRGIFVEVSGRLKLKFVDDTICDIAVSGAGYMFPGRDIKVVMTSTDATVHGFR